MTDASDCPRPTGSEFARQLAACKADVWRLVQRLPGPEMAAALREQVQPDAHWHIFHPLNQLAGTAAVADQFYGPLQAAFPDLERRTDLFFGGFWSSPPPGALAHSPPGVRAEGWWVTVMGHYMGSFTQPWLGIPATGDVATLRFGEFYRWQPHPSGQGGQIVEARVLLDIVDLARQAGRRLLPVSAPSAGLRPARPPRGSSKVAKQRLLESSGQEWQVPGPGPGDGLLRGATDPAVGAESLRLTLAMFKGLWDYDGINLDSMGMDRFWHPHMMWYGPCGIGSMRGVRGFQRHHQRPFLHAFPDRQGLGHRARIAEGPFVASTGWPSVGATHSGAYLGVPATHRPITMRVADWWRCDSRLLTENWVLIDLPHLMLQMDVDLMAALRD